MAQQRRQPAVPVSWASADERPTMPYGLSYSPAKKVIDHGPTGAAAIKKYMEVWILDFSQRHPEWVGIQSLDSAQQHEKVRFQTLNMELLDED